MNERREYQRLHLTQPLDGSFGDVPVRVVDVSVTGAQIEHPHAPLPHDGTLRFTWRDETVEVRCQTVHLSDERAGLHFVDDSELLRRLIAQSASEVLAAQQANMEGDREHNVIGDIGEETLTAASAGLKAKAWIMLTLEEGGWKRRKSLLPDQPQNGFTVSAAEPDEQVEILCKTYEAGDEEARSLTRLLAELSALSVINR